MSRVAVLAVLLLLASLASAALFPARTPVVNVANPSHFRKEVLAIEKPTLVAFTAPWCGHCQRLVPHFHGAASKLDGVVKFANVDCDAEANKATCAKYGVRGFPTIKVFPASKRRLPRDYERERTEQDLVTYAEGLLPASARKLQAAELQVWVDKDVERPKVILFSTRPVASPVYRSLALDFRSSVDFAHMRGDEQVVRSAARLALGLDMATERDLPVLVILPARSTDAELEKSEFETYAGKLKYWPVKRWLDEVAPKMGAQVGKKAAAPPKKAAKKAPTVKPKKAPAKPPVEYYDDDKENIVPDGGFVEWKAAKNDFGRPGTYASSYAAGDDAQTETHIRVSEPGGEPTSSEEEEQKKDAESKEDEPLMDTEEPMRETFRGKMLDIERAGQLADEIRAQRKQVQEEAKRQKQMRSPRAKKEEKTVDGDEKEGLMDRAKKALDDAGGRASDALGKLFDSDGGDDEGASSPFKAKGRALMAQFEKWMSGEDVEWSAEHADVYEEAQREAEALLARDPEKARELAWQSEKWLLDELEADRTRMAGIMTQRQRKQVDDMIDLVKGRLSERDSGKDVFERTDAANPLPDEDEPEKIEHEDSKSNKGEDKSKKSEHGEDSKPKKVTHEEL